MSFATLSILIAIAALLLAVGWLFFGNLMIRRWGGESTEMALVIGRRIAAVYLSIGLLFFFARSTTSAELITLLCTFAVIANGLLAGLGTYEFLKRRVGSAIFVSVAVEVFLLISFARLLLT